MFRRFGGLNCGLGMRQSSLLYVHKRIEQLCARRRAATRFPRGRLRLRPLLSLMRRGGFCHVGTAVQNFKRPAATKLDGRRVAAMDKTSSTHMNSSGWGSRSDAQLFTSLTREVSMSGWTGLAERAPRRRSLPRHAHQLSQASAISLHAARNATSAASRSWIQVAEAGPGSAHR